jgi:uracil-DNA glycosylase family 4
MSASKQQLMDILDDQIAQCHMCPLNDGYWLPVPGIGSVDPDLFILLEAPAKEESDPRSHPNEKFGVPAIGPAGTELQQEMYDIGFGKFKLYVTNTVRHKTPNNRPPALTEKIACSHWLKAQLMILRPKVILALGKHASEVLRIVGNAPPLDEKESHRWKNFDFYMPIEGLTPLTARVFATYHPSYACLRNPDMRPYFREDLKKVFSYLEGEINE